MRSINHQETMLLGMAMTQQEDIREMNVSLASLSERLDTFELSVNNRFETQQRLIESFEQSVNGRLDAIEGRFDAVESRFDAVESRFGAMENRLGTLEGRFEAQDKKLDEIRGMLAGIMTKLE